MICIGKGNMFKTILMIYLRKLYRKLNLYNF